VKVAVICIACIAASLLGGGGHAAAERVWPTPCAFPRGDLDVILECRPRPRPRSSWWGPRLQPLVGCDYPGACDDPNRKP
jgi:hypothetical protein